MWGVRRSILVVSTTVLLFGLAGCVGQDDLMEELATSSTPGSAVPSGVPDGEVDASVRKTSLLPEPVEVPIVWEGKTGSRVGAYFQRPDDVRNSVSLAPASRLLLPSTPGKADRATLTLTWTASNPLNNELQLWVGGLSLCKSTCSSEGNFTYGKEVTSVHGPSPLKFEVESILVSQDEHLGIIVRQPSRTPDNYKVILETDQAFRLEGTITFLVPPA